MNVFRRHALVGASLLSLALAGASTVVHAQIAVSANDGKMRLDNGVTKVVKDGVDSIDIIDFNSSPPKVLGSVKAPTSLVGPPTSVAVSPNEEFALVTAAMKIDPTDPTKQVADDKLHVLDLVKSSGFVRNIAARVQGKQAPPAYEPKVIATVQVGQGPAGVSINKAGTLALVANRSEGTVSVLEIKGKTVTAIGEKIKLGDAKSGPSAVSFTPDGKTALVTRDGDHKISVLAVDGTTVTDTKREISAGLRPYGLDVSSKGDVAVVANIGTNSGDPDTISVIDLAAKPPRVVNTVSVGQTPEGIKISPDGNYVAITVMNGTNKAKDSPFFNEQGKLVILRRQGRDLARVGEANIGKWCQGVVWSSNSRKVAAQCVVEEQIMAFSWNGRQLQPAGTVKVSSGGPGGIRTAEK